MRLFICIIYMHNPVCIIATEKRCLRATGVRAFHETEKTTFCSSVVRDHFDPAQWCQFRVSPFIFMKIKSGEWKHVYKRREN